MKHVIFCLKSPYVNIRKADETAATFVGILSKTVNNLNLNLYKENSYVKTKTTTKLAEQFQNQIEKS